MPPRVSRHRPHSGSGTRRPPVGPVRRSTPARSPARHPPHLSPSGTAFLQGFSARRVRPPLAPGDHHALATRRHAPSGRPGHRPGRKPPAACLSPRPAGDNHYGGRTRSNDAPRGPWWGKSRRDPPDHEL